MKYHVHGNPLRLQLVWLLMAAIVAVVAGPSRAPAQENPCTRSTIFINVENRSGGRVNGLDAANFHGSVGKEAVQIESAEAARVRRIVIVLDQSGSMYVTDAYASAASLIANIVTHAPAEFQFALLTYSKSSQVRKSLTSDRNELINALREAMAVKAPDGPSATSSTLDAAIAGLELLSPSEPGGAVLLVTDGGESSSKASESDVELRFTRILTSASSRQFPITPATPYASPEYQKALAQPLRKMVEGIGGEVFWFAGKPPVVRIDPDQKNLPSGPAGIIEKMMTGYRLQIATPTTVTKPVDLKLEITGNSDWNNSGIVLRYQPKLYPCAVHVPQK